MTLQDFIKQVNDELTISCSLPFSIPSNEIERLVNIYSEWFYREYRDSIQSEMLLVDPGVFQLPEFRSSRQIKMPNKVMSIEKIMEVKNGGRLFGINDPDASFSRIINADMYLSPWSTETITYRTMQWSFWDLTKSFDLIDIQHSYNYNSKILTIKGRDIYNYLFMWVKNKIPLEDLMDDPIFFRYISGRAKMQLNKVLNTISYTLIGNTTINTAQIYNEGKDDVTYVENYIKENNAGDWMVLFN